MSEQSYSELKSLGIRFYEAKKWEQAIKAFEEAKELDFGLAYEDDDLFFKIAYSYYELSQIDEAQEAYEECVAINDENGPAWSNLGVCHEKNENWDEALESFQNAVLYSPRLVHAWQGIVRSASKLEDKETQIEALKQVVSLIPASSHWRNELGRTYYNSGKQTDLWHALNAFFQSARLDKDPCHPGNAALVYRKQSKWLDAADAYAESLRRNPAYASSITGMSQIRAKLLSESKKIHEFAAILPRCKNPYERYLNPFEVLSIDGSLEENPNGTSLRKLKQRVIQLIQLNDGVADWLDGAEIGESRVRQILDELDDTESNLSEWHWAIYKCPSFNRFLSHGSPLLFAFFQDQECQNEKPISLYWDLRNLDNDDQDFIEFIQPAFQANFETLLTKALEQGDADLVSALCSGRLPTQDAFDYFERANIWLKEQAAEVKRYIDGLKTPQGQKWWKETTNPMAWFAVKMVNALPNECQPGRTEIARSLRALSLELHNEHQLTKQAVAVTNAAIQLQVSHTVTEQMQKDRDALNKILSEIKKQEEEELRWNLFHKIRSDEIEVNKFFVRYNSTKIATDKILGVRYGVFKQYTNGIPTYSTYSIGVTGGGTEIAIECKRAFRGEQEAQNDFVKILESLGHQVFPNLILGYANDIVEGKRNLQVGPLVLTQNGIQCETGSLWWKKGHVIPYSLFQFVDSSGVLHVSSQYSSGISFQLDRRTVWNAVILERLVEIIKLMNSKRI
jgi:tetratricopeptide (TPR) repeat protein